MLTVLSVAYPLAPVGPDAVGGSEQILSLLDQALAARGDHSLVLACAGSEVAGTLIAMPGLPDHLDMAVCRALEPLYLAEIEAAVARYDVDLVHMHGFNFHACIPREPVSVLATMHLPPDWHPAGLFSMQRRNFRLNCVSQNQRHAMPATAFPVQVVANGVAPGPCPAAQVRQDFVLALGRICPEKGYHFALDAARAAGRPLLLGGKVFPYDAHTRYFEEEIRPRLDDQRRWLGPVAHDRKRRLLAAARCLVIPSTVAETSSLVAMEALAAGTPVIAFPSGALPEIIEHGKTGFIVNDAAEMAEAIDSARQIDGALCRAAAAERFSADRMVRDYFRLYDDMLVAAGRLPQRLATVEDGPDSAFANGSVTPGSTRTFRRGIDAGTDLQNARAPLM